MKEQWKLMVLLVIVIAIVLFSLQNIGVVDVNFFGLVTYKMPLVLVILVSLLLGVFLGMLTSLTSLHQNKKRVRQLESNITRLTADNESKQNEVENSVIKKEHLQQEVSAYKTQVEELKMQLDQSHEELDNLRQCVKNTELNKFVAKLETSDE